MFKLNVLHTAALLAMSATVPAMAQEAQPQQLERVEVTGSSIKRVNAEGPMPVQIVKREDIERRGMTTLNEVINNLTLVSQGSFADTAQAGNSFAPGTAGVSLRGLGTNATLVLVNGRRMANYGFAQNLDEAFVDLNSIPTSAIERVEVLKDGASAIYGSDALAGVVNVILRKDYRGLELSGNAGTSQDGGATEYSATLSAGFGDISSDRFNVFGVLSVYDREKLGAGERDFSKNPDKTSEGGLDFRSPTGNPGTWLIGGRGTDPATGQPYADNRVFPSCPSSSVGTFSDGRTTCYYNFAPDNWLVPKTERVGLYTRATFELGADLTAFAELGLNKNVTNGSAAPTPGSTTLPVGHNSNPFPFAVPIRYRFVEVGPRLNEIDTEASRATLGLQGTHFGWDWKSGVVVAKSETVNTGSNYINSDAVTAARPTYNYLNPALNSAAVVNSLRASPVRVGESEMKSFDFGASRELFDMAGGAAAVALGVDYREESLADTPDPLSIAGKIVGSGGTSSKGDRDLTALYTEFSLPAFKNFEAQIALRQDRYSDFGNKVTPKIAFSYKPTGSLLVRGGYSEGFRAPSLVQLYLGRSISFGSFRDVVRCDAYTAAVANGVAGVTPAMRTAACGSPQVMTENIGNKTLKAEESKSYTLGVVFEPTKEFSVGFDFWKIEHTNKIDTLPSSYVLRNAAALAGVLGRPVVVRNPASPSDVLAGAPGAIRGTGADTEVGLVNTYFNAQAQEVQGVDIDLRLRFNLGEMGKLSLSNVLTYMDSFKREVTPNGGMEELIGTWQYPKVRMNTIAAWDVGSWQYTLGANLTGSYDQFYQVGPTRLQERMTFDAQVQYTGFKNIKLAVGGRNVLNTKPPFGDVDYYGYDASNTDPRGAVWYVRGSYKF